MDDVDELDHMDEKMSIFVGLIYYMDKSVRNLLRPGNKTRQKCISHIFVHMENQDDKKLHFLVHVVQFVHIIHVVLLISFYRPGFTKK